MSGTATRRRTKKKVAKAASRKKTVKRTVKKKTTKKASKTPKRKTVKKKKGTKSKKTVIEYTMTPEEARVIAEDLFLSLPYSMNGHQGYKPRHVDVAFSEAQAHAIHAVLGGLQKHQCKMSNDRVPTSAHDVVRYIADKIVEAIERREAVRLAD